MTVTGPVPSSEPTKAFVYRAAVVGAAAYAWCDTLHELAHVAVTWLPGHGSVLLISSVGISTTTSDPTVALAGPLLNLLLAATMLLSARAAFTANWRYAFWVFGTVNLFNGTAYLVYSGVLGSGDWAVVFGAFSPPAVWRPIAVIVGIALYAGAIRVSSRAARRFVAEGVVSDAQMTQSCQLTYWAGGALLVAASALNPIDPLLILTSGAATGFGAMAGLMLLPAFLKVSPGVGRSGATPVAFGTAWLVGSGLVALAFVIVLGHGVRLAPRPAASVAALAAG